MGSRTENSVKNKSEKRVSNSEFYICSPGQALLELDSLDEAIVHLQRAQELAKEQKLNFGDEIAVQLRIARKKRWNQQEEKRVQQEVELQAYLNELILADCEKKLREAGNNKASGTACCFNRPFKTLKIPIQFHVFFDICYAAVDLMLGKLDNHLKPFRSLSGRNRRNT